MIYCRNSSFNIYYIFNIDFLCNQITQNYITNKCSILLTLKFAQVIRHNKTDDSYCQSYRKQIYIILQIYFLFAKQRQPTPNITVCCPLFISYYLQQLMREVNIRLQVVFVSETGNIIISANVYFLYSQLENVSM